MVKRHAKAGRIVRDRAAGSRALGSNISPPSGTSARPHDATSPTSPSASVTARAPKATTPVPDVTARAPRPSAPVPTSSHTPRPTPSRAAAKAKPTAAKKAAAKKKTVSDPTPGARPPPSSRSGARGRFARQHALSDVRAALHATGGATVYELAERLGVSVRTVIRYLQALEETGEGLYDEREGHKKIWRLAAGGRTSVLHLTTSQMTALYLSRKVVGFLEGTGFSEDLEEVFHKLELTLKRRDFAATQKLGKKLFSVNEAPHIYAGRDEHVNAILTALTREERLLAQHESVGRGQARFRIDPYTLLVYKKGLYLAGLSDHHGAIRTFSLDGFQLLEWRKNERYDYPEDYSPEQLVEGTFGLIAGERTRVRIAFTPRVARYVRRRQWHPSQKIIEQEGGGVVLELEVRGTVELVSWVLGFGEHAEVLSPESLRRELARELTAALVRYTPKA